MQGENIQQEIDTLVKRVEWVEEDLNTTTQHLIGTILTLVERIREDSPEIARDMLNGVSFAWEGRAERIDQLIREAEEESRREEAEWEVENPEWVYSKAEE